MASAEGMSIISSPASVPCVTASHLLLAVPVGNHTHSHTCRGNMPLAALRPPSSVSPQKACPAPSCSQEGGRSCTCQVRGSEGGTHQREGTCSLSQSFWKISSGVLGASPGPETPHISASPAPRPSAAGRLESITDILFFNLGTWWSHWDVMRKNQE